MGVDFKRDPSEFTAIMAFETMETFDPAIRPRRKDGSLVSSAVGLIQFLESTAQALGTTTKELSIMTVEQQLPFVWRYFHNFFQEKGQLAQSLEDLYMVVNWPKAFGLPNDATMYVAGTAAFTANAGLDVNRDSIITKAEAGALVRAKLVKGLLPENVA